jgi:hypothetical protein
MASRTFVSSLVGIDIDRPLLRRMVPAHGKRAQLCKSSSFFALKLPGLTMQHWQNYVNPFDLGRWRNLANFFNLVEYELFPPVSIDKLTVDFKRAGSERHPRLFLSYARLTSAGRGSPWWTLLVPLPIPPLGDGWTWPKVDGWEQAVLNSEDELTDEEEAG